MAEAGNLDQEVRHWTDLAKCWARDFGNRDNALKCIELAQDLAEGEESVSTLAYHFARTAPLSSVNSDRFVRDSS